MPRPTVIKGGLVAVRGNKSVTKIFMFNPNEIDDSKGISWGSAEVPGASHPVYQFGAGQERLISFTLYLDGDRGKLGKLPKNNSGVPSGDAFLTDPFLDATDPTTFKFKQRNPSGISIASDLAFYESLKYPNNYERNIEAVFPFTVIFSFGDRYRQVPCIVKKADIKIFYWTPRLEPVRASISMGLAEISSISQTADMVLDRQGMVFDDGGYL